MLVLFFLGRDVEELYGPKEFLRLYLAMVVFARWYGTSSNVALHQSAWLGAYGRLARITGLVIFVCPELPTPHLAAVLRHPHPGLAARP